MNILDWEETDQAKALLCELDAVVRSSDFCIGRGWNEAARGHSERAREIESELDDLRSAAIYACADAAGEKETDAWWSAVDDAEMTATATADAARIAARLHWGDGILEQAA